MDEQNQTQIIPTATETYPTAAAPTAQVKYAGFWIRFAAYLFDALVISFAFNLIYIPLFLLTKPLTTTINWVFLGIMFFIQIIIVAFYYILLTYKYQATFGKMILGLKVVSKNFERPSLGRVIVREIPAKIISGLILYIGFVMAGFTQRKQALHDKIARTVVVYKDPSKKIAMEAAGLAVGSAAVSIILGMLLTKLPINKNIISQSSNLKTPSAMDALDKSVEANVSSVAIGLMDYDIEHDSYGGFSVDPKDTKDWEDTMGQYCQISLKVDISPDGKKFIVHQPLCSDQTKSACYEDTSSEVSTVDTATVEKTYTCK